MANNKHLTYDNRNTIESVLKQNVPFKKIAEVLDKDPSTISKEIRLHCYSQRTGGKYINFNACALRSTCDKSHICSVCHSHRKFKTCKNCSMCNSFCRDFKPMLCQKLSKPPYVCNGCSSRMYCTLEKQFYSAKYAQETYRKVLSETRIGISLSEAEIQHLDEIVTPLLKKQQSPHNICVHNKDSIMVSERTLYRLIDARVLSARNLDLPRKVRFSARKNRVHVKVDKTCRIGRDFDAFKEYIAANPDSLIVQLDSVEGIKGSKVLLTIHFVKAEFMLAFLRDHNDSQSVIDIFDSLYQSLGLEQFKNLFQLCLADNGSEFSNPTAIEFDKEHNQRTRIFYCNPSAPYQKGSAERNHEFIRYFIPKGTDLAHYTQAQISLMMDHINSYGRGSLLDKSPYDMFAFLYGEDILRILECHKIPPNDVTLNKSIFRKEVRYDS